MIMTRSRAVTAAVAAAASLTAVGITYATASPAPQVQTAPAAAHAAPAPAAAQVAPAPMDGGVGGKGKEGNDRNDYGGKGNDRGDRGDRGDRNDRGDRGDRGREFEEGRIQINERSYSSHPGGCITVVSGLGSTSLNVRNDSRKTVEVFRGATCDNGAPIATVGPHSSSDGVRTGHTKGVHVWDGVVGSFRVINNHRGDERDW
ncbi:hypothetical protein [Streptomyces sp. NPDC046821]|uniref:hypothetical protein n=1 Tax=Streptomyces sp. NPDC046821 TaxID=3154702 RepID=UPI0033C8396B